MSDSTEALRRAWVARVLGVQLPSLASGALPPKGTVTTASPTGTPQVHTGPDGRRLEVVVGPDGRTELRCPKPPLREITFSGGGGKGTALAGAVRALEESGTLADVHEIHGASVGSMTAAMLGAGMNAKDFTYISNEVDTEALVKGGDKVALNLKGDALEAFVRQQMTLSVVGRINEFVSKSSGDNPISPAQMKILDDIEKRLGTGTGVTFSDLRVLSKFIPGIKEVAISGTKIGKQNAKGGIDKTTPELMMFDADTQPDMDVAKAVHASASLPPVFKPVNLTLQDGSVAQFEDGGVMNNAPSSDVLGSKRQVDPIPDSSGMTFVFEDDAAHEILRGEATPSRSAIMDFIAGADYGATSYATNRALADKPEDVVMVPLTFTAPDGKEKDFSGLRKGTVNFNMPIEDRLTLQGLSEKATQANIDQRAAPQANQYDSTGQMLMCARREDVAVLAQDGFPGAVDALGFRDTIVADVAKLESMAAAGQGAASPDLIGALNRMQQLAGNDDDRVAFIGRELNRSGKLDALIASLRHAPLEQPRLVQVAGTVADALAARQNAQAVLRKVIYPKMVRVKPDSVAGTVLRQVDTRLRRAQSPEDVNAALDIAARQFARKGVISRGSDQDFVDALKPYRMEKSA